ncbi:MAG: hypothetical protein V2I33_22220, partial [Kangiellaceae bacterium]|nr:hypothetical protein [Kangiellaceae bacterium]
EVNSQNGSYSNTTIQPPGTTSDFLSLPISGAKYDINVWTVSNDMDSQEPATTSARTSRCHYSRIWTSSFSLLCALFTVPPALGGISCLAHNESSLQVNMTAPSQNFEAHHYVLKYYSGNGEPEEVKYDMEYGPNEIYVQVISRLTPGTNYTIEGYLSIDSETSEIVATHCSTCKSHFRTIYYLIIKIRMSRPFDHWNMI